MDLLKDRLALVTGAGGGLGSAIALGMAREGAIVIAADINAEAAKRTAAAIVEQGGRAFGEALDVTDRAAVNAFARRIAETRGPLRVLVNNAGISGRSKIDEPSAPEVWDRILSVNLDGVFNVTHAFVPALKQTRGCIVNLSSIVAFVSAISSAGYIASKGAVRSFTQALARDLAPYGVRTNAVAPGVMLTEMVAPQLATEAGIHWFLNRAPMARGGEPEEIVGPVIFLASDMASYVNGAVLPVDGGFLSH